MSTTTLSLTKPVLLYNNTSAYCNHYLSQPNSNLWSTTYSTLCSVLDDSAKKVVEVVRGNLDAVRGKCGFTFERKNSFTYQVTINNSIPPALFACLAKKAGQGNFCATSTFTDDCIKKLIPDLLNTNCLDDVGNDFVIHLLASQPNLISLEFESKINPLMLAAYKGHKQIVKYLLHAGLDLNLMSSQGYSPLMFAALGGHLEIVRLLLDSKAEVDSKNNEGGSALFIAAQNGHLEIVRLLLDRKAEVDLKINTGGTALIIAALRGHLEIVRLLLDRKAQVDLKINTGGTALMFAAQNGHLEIVRLLLDRKAEVDLKCNNGLTALMSAVTHRREKVVELLLRNKADFNVRFNKDVNLLMFATEDRQKEIVELLLKYGANPDSQTSFGSRAIDLVANRGYYEILDVFLKYNANVKAVEPTLVAPITMSPYRIAQCNGHEKVASVLLNAGSGSWFDYILPCQIFKNRGNITIFKKPN